MTKYHQKRFDQQDTPIIAAEEELRQYDNRDKEYICSTCRRTLSRLVDYSGENIHAYYCSGCKVESLPDEELRPKSKLKVPGGAVEYPYVAYPNEPTLGKKETNYKGAFAQLSKRSGLRIIDYTETSGSGKILGRRR